MHWLAIWYKKSIVHLQITPAMWKYITILSLVVLAAGAFVFYKTHTGIASASGELTALQTQFDSAAAKNKEIFVDKIIAAYAKMRGEWLKQRKEEVVLQKAKLEEEIAGYKSEIERLSQEWQSMGGETEENKKKMQELLVAMAGNETLTKALSDAAEKDGVEVQPMDPSDPGVLDALAANLRQLEKKTLELAEDNTRKEAAIGVLAKQKEELEEQIKAADALAKERQARVSPKELNARVVISDPSWDYVIIDAGMDDGVIIGSRLATMRGDKKICEMNVTVVEGHRSSCDIIYDTLTTGEVVKQGDRVISVREPEKED